jgi:hypothetical protein
VSVVRLRNNGDAAHRCSISSAAPTMSLRVTIAGTDRSWYAVRIRMALPALRSYHACGGLAGTI